MGWLELLALMKRVLPLLSRVAPMLETYIAARGATRGDAEALETLSGDLNYIKAHTVAESQNRIAIQETLDAQGNRIEKFGDELEHMRSAGSEQAARLERIEQQLASVGRLFRVAFALTGALLLACVGLLAELLLRR